MLQTILRLMLPAVCLALFWTTGSHELSTATAAECGYPAWREDLFYNYYVGRGYYGNGVPAQMYLSPRPTPPWVGHTYVTYQPFMPHEFMYAHKRTYTRWHCQGGMTRTKIRWH